MPPAPSEPLQPDTGGMSGREDLALRECAKRSLPGALVYSVVVGMVWVSTDFAEEYPWLVGLVFSLLLVLGLLRTWVSYGIVQSWWKPDLLRRRLFAATTAGTCGVWGLFSGFTASQYVTSPKGLLVLLSTAALTAGVTTSLAPNRRLAWFCISLLAGPTILGAMPRPEAEAQAFALLSLLYSLFLLTQLHLNHQSFWRGQLAEEIESSRLEAVRFAAAKSQLLATMSHEVRTPLHGVVGMIELVLGAELPAEAQKYATHARDAALHLVGVVNRILQFSRNESTGIPLELAPFEIREWLERETFAFASEARKKGLVFQVEIDTGGERWYLGDSVRLSQILANLLSNALKFTTAGEIRVILGFGPGPPNKEGWEALLLRVRDTGRGMTKQVLAQLFEPFGHSEIAGGQQGAGLGLAITRQIINALEGEITVESEPGVGTEFCVQLPLQRTEPAAPALGWVPADAPRSGVRVLVVEDDPVSAMVAQRLLERLGAIVVVANTGAEAMRQVAETFDLFLLDWQLPDANGMELAAYIRQHNHHHRATIVLASATDSEDAREQGRRFGVNGYLAKPYTLEQLRGILKLTS